MNLYLRMLWVLLSSFFKPRLPVSALQNELTQRVLPNDLDLNMHMNNGRFLTICDLTRVDLFVRTGLLAVMLAEKWSPIIAEHTMTYRKAMRLFQRYTVSMEITHYDDKHFYATHRFTSNGKVVAEGTSKAIILGREGVIPPTRVVNAVQRRQMSDKRFVLEA